MRYLILSSWSQLAEIFNVSFIANLVTIYFLMTAAMRGGVGEGYWERGDDGDQGLVKRDAAFKLSLTSHIQLSSQQTSHHQLCQLGWKRDYISTVLRIIFYKLT